MANYLYDEVSSDGTYEGAVGSDANPPVKLGVAAVVRETTEKFWVGVTLAELGCNKTVNVSKTLYLRYRENGGSWQDLGSGNLAVAGTGNMAYTDLSPPNADAWVAQNNSCGSGLEPGDQVAQDNSNNLATGTGTGDYTKEFWFACNPTSVAQNTKLEFAIYDSTSVIGTSASPYLLDITIFIKVDLTVANSSHLLTTNGDNSALYLIHPLTVADCSHLSDSIPENLTLTEVQGAISLVMTDGGATHVVTSPELPPVQIYPDDCQHLSASIPENLDFDLTVTVNDSTHAITTNGDNSALNLTVHLVVAGATHVLYTQDPLWWPSKGIHLHSAENILIDPAWANAHDCSHVTTCDGPITITEESGAIDLVMTDGGATHLLTTNGDNSALALIIPLLVAGATHVIVTNGDDSPLDLDLVITVAGTTHLLTTNGDNSPLSLTVPITVAGATHVLYTQDPLWWPSSCTHLHSAENIVIDPAWANTQDCTHLSDSIPENINLTEVGDVTLTMSDGGASHVVTSPELPATQVYPDGATHSHVVSPTNLTLVEVFTLTIAPDPYHLTVTKDEVWFVQKSIHQVGSQPSDVTLTLTVSVDACVHVIEDSGPLTLVQIFDLVVAGCTHVHTAPNLTISELGPVDLVNLDASHLHSAPNLALVVDTGLDVADAIRTIVDLSTKYTLHLL